MLLYGQFSSGLPRQEVNRDEGPRSVTTFGS